MIQKLAILCLFVSSLSFASASVELDEEEAFLAAYYTGSASCFLAENQFGKGRTVRVTASGSTFNSCYDSLRSQCNALIASSPYPRGGWVASDINCRSN